MARAVETLRKIYESHEEITAENNSFDRFKAQKEREAHVLVRARLAEISMDEARKSMSREKLVSDLGAFIGMQLFADEEWKANRTLAKELSMWGQSIIRASYMGNVEELLNSDAGTASLEFPPLPDISTVEKLPEHKDGPDPTEQRVPRKSIPKAFFITIPLALLALTFSVGSNGHQTLFPLWQRLIFAVLIAALGSRRLRIRAFVLLVLAFIIAWMLGG
jgi:hypothetical protein